MKHARFVTPARQEFLAEVAHYRAVQPELAARFVAAVEEVTCRAMAFPLSGTPGPNKTRRLSVKDFPFSIVYRSERDGVIVFAVAHHSREPGYWQPRVQDR